ncbi:MAG: alpha/beta hydrolase [Planctomycetota bacterium]
MIHYPITSAAPRAVFLVGALFILASTCSGDDPSPATQGVLSGVSVDPGLSAREDAPELARFDYAEARFSWELAGLADFPSYRVFHLTFPSPYTSPVKENNTVHAEFHLPNGSGPFPAVVILHILDGRLAVSRLIAGAYAPQGIASLIVTMPYYRERRLPDSPRQGFVSEDLDRLADAVRQAVMDTSRAGAFLRGHPAIDPERVGLIGTSLGGIVGSVAAAADARFRRVVLILAGGGLADILYGAPETSEVRKRLEARGLDVAAVRAKLEVVDPLTYARRIGPGRVLLVNATQDATVPPSSARALAEAIPATDQLWYPATHEGLVAHVPEILEKARLWLFPTQGGHY